MSSTTFIKIANQSEVKPGDTATLRKDSMSVTGPVVPCAGSIHVRHEGQFISDRFSACTDTGWKFVSASRKLPEWEPGTVADITHVGEISSDRFTTRALRSNGDWVPFTDVADLIEDHEVTNVRPLMIVDPAAAYDTLTGFFEVHRRDPGESSAEFAVRALEVLDIEVPA